MTRLILGSSSPRRLQILEQIKFPPALCVAADIDETPHKNEKPVVYVQRIASEKNNALALQFPDDYLLTADTTCAVGRRIFGKASDRAEAEMMLRTFSGRSHFILTAVVLRAPDGRVASRLFTARVTVKNMDAADIHFFLDTNEWQDRAGAYHFTGAFARFIRQSRGCSSGILGLPAFETTQLLQGMGYSG